LIVIAAGLLIAGLAVYTAVAQQGMRQPAAPQMGAPQIAFVDVGFVFKKHAGLQSRKAALEAEMKRAAEAVKQEQTAIRKLKAELDGMAPGSQEYKQMEGHVAKRLSDMEIQLRLQQKEFASRESNMYFTVYQEVEQEVGYVASQNGFSAVMFIDGDKPDGSRLPQVQMYVNKQIVWHDSRLDITPEVVRRLEAKYGAQSGSGTPTTQRSRTGVPNPNFR
jgi:Skp family chaperone for outer membrane proteins